MHNRIAAIVTPLIYFVAVPGIVLLWRGAHHNVVSVLVAVLVCIPFFIRFEKNKTGVRELVVLSVMTAISVAGRLIFTPFPAFKPVSAITMITGIAFGPMAGFITGSMSAVVSNIFFGQGPWTPFQMLVWGLIGFLSGAIFRRGKRPHPVALIAAGVLGGVLFSVGMDVWTTLSVDGDFQFSRYLFHATAALPVTADYAISNVVFLLLLTKPMLAKTERLRVKYGVFEHNN